MPRATVRAIVRYVVSILAGFVILALLFGKRSDLSAAWHQLRDVDPAWALAAIGAETMSLWLFGVQQFRVLRMGGSHIPLRGLFVLTVASNAIANTVPAEPAVSGAYRFRYFRQRGASGPSAGWAVFTTVVAQAIGVTVLLLLGIAIALATNAKGVTVGVAVVAILTVVGACLVLARRDLLVVLAGWLVRAFRRVTGYPRDQVGARIEAALARMLEIPLTGPAAASVAATGTAVWAFDFLCLLCGFGAVRAAVPWDGVLLAYGVAQMVGALPIIPGGLGVVEGSLTVILVAYGARRVPAVSVVLAYRMVSFWLAIVAGWITFAVLARRQRHYQG